MIILKEQLYAIMNSFNALRLMTINEIIVAVIEIAIMTYVIYKVISFSIKKGLFNILFGIGIIILLCIIAALFNFSVIMYIINKIAFISAIALIVIFQNDLRVALEHLGRKFVPKIMTFTKKMSDSTVQEIAKASFAMGKVKTGALIVIEKSMSLEDIEKTGIAIEGKVTNQLLINIFEKNTPLHDGAVLIVGDIVKAATCYLPLSNNESISKELGTRHRAAIGISEKSDAKTVVVSEETGRVSLVENGELNIVNDENELIMLLLDSKNTEAKSQTQINNEKVKKGGKNENK